MKILITGGAGFIGSYLVPLLYQSGHEVVIYDNLSRGTLKRVPEYASFVYGELSDLQTLDFVASDCDAIIHLAASWLLECVENPVNCIAANVLGTQNVITAAHGKRIVFASSASVYGDAEYFPMDEKHPLNNRTVYGATKIAGEQLLRSECKDYVVLRFFNLYGPGQDSLGAYVGIIPKVIAKIDAGEIPEIHGDGKQTYDFVYVTDAARALVMAIESDAKDVAINVCTGVGTTVKDLVLKLVEIKHGPEPVYVKVDREFVTQRVGDPTLAEGLLGFKSQVSVDEGLRRMCQ